MRVIVVLLILPVARLELTSLEIRSAFELHRHIYLIDTLNNTCYNINILKERSDYKIKSYSSRKIIKILEQDGWYLYKVTGDHYQFKHHAKKGTVTVPHPRKDLSVFEVKSISKQSGVIF